jgi:hypothetical protein
VLNDRVIMNNEFERMWKDVVMAEFKVITPSICQEVLRSTVKTSVRQASLQARILIWDLPNMKQDANHLTAVFNVAFAEENRTTQLKRTRSWPCNG